MLQLERLVDYPMVRQRSERGEVFLHGWYYVIEEGQVLVLDVAKGRFEATDIPPPGDGDHATPNAFQLQ